MNNLILDFGNNEIGITGAVKLGESVSKLLNLTILNLNFSGNRIGV